MQQISLPNPRTSKLSYAVLLISVVLVWFSLIVQFSISIPNLLNQGHSLPGAIVQLLSFFTILTNLLTGIALTALLLRPSGGGFFRQGYVNTGIALYITIVCLIYNTVLLGLVQLTGLALLADKLMHLINPVLFVVYWLFFLPKEKLKWRQSLNWLWFPFCYFSYTLIRGAIVQWYPYPFVDAGKLGYIQVLFNSLLVLCAFLVPGLLFVAVSRFMAARKQG